MIEGVDNNKVINLLGFDMKIKIKIEVDGKWKHGEIRGEGRGTYRISFCG